MNKERREMRKRKWPKGRLKNNRRGRGIRKEHSRWRKNEWKMNGKEK